MEPHRGDRDQTHDRGVWFRAIAAVIVRPWLWWTAMRQVFLLAPRGWWRRAPFLPRPDGAYVRFRLETAYGYELAPRAGDLVAYLDWCRARRRMIAHPPVVAGAAGILPAPEGVRRALPRVTHRGRTPRR